MKRIGNLYNKIISIENLEMADAIASLGKSKQYGVIRHNKNKEANILLLHEMLKNKTFMTSPYDIITIFERKEREIYRLPYFPDRIVHHAIMIYLEPMFVKTFTADTYSCIKGKGVHGASYALRKALKNVQATQYYLQLDIKKFYPSIDHNVLKTLIRKKIKDNDLLWLMDGIIDSAKGMPIGNYLSQYLANFYVSYLDHHIKQNLAVKHLFRYTDDYILLSDSKEHLWKLFAEIKRYLNDDLLLTVKPNYRIAPVKCGIKFVGYIHFHTHVLLIKRTKKSFARKLKKNNNPASIASYMGWVKHCNSKNLIKKLLPNEQIF